MLIIISKIVFILSLLGVLFIIYRKLPAISRASEEPFTSKFSFRKILARISSNFKRFILSHFFQNIILGTLEKSLRKIKILVLKIDNITEKFIRKLRKSSDT